MIGILLFVVIVCFVGLKKKSKIKTGDPLLLGSKGVAKERLMRDKLLKSDFKVAISKKRYHKIGCRYADKEGSFCSISMAKERKLLACKVCQP